MIDKKQRDTQILNSSAASDQLVLAAELKPRKFRSKWQRIVYEGPTARKDLEDAERARWVASLGDLLRHTDTPMGRLLQENQRICSCWDRDLELVLYVLGYDL